MYTTHNSSNFIQIHLNRYNNCAYKMYVLIPFTTLHQNEWSYISSLLWKHNCFFSTDFVVQKNIQRIHENPTWIFYSVLLNSKHIFFSVYTYNHIYRWIIYNIICFFEAIIIILIINTILSTEVWLVICSKNTFFIFVLKVFFYVRKNVFYAIKNVFLKSVFFMLMCFLIFLKTEKLFYVLKTKVEFFFCSENESAQGSWIFFVLMVSLKFQSVKYFSNPTRTAWQAACMKALFTI